MDISLIEKLHLKGQGVVSIIGAGGKTSLMFYLAKELACAGKTILTTTTTHIFMPKPNQSPDTIIAETFDDLVEKSRSLLNRFNHFSAGSRQIPDLGKLKGFAPDIIDQLRKADCFDWIIVEADGAKRKPIKATNFHEPVVPETTTHLIHVTGLDAIGKPLDNDNVHRAQLFSDNTGLALGAAIDEQSIARSAVIEIKKAAALAPLSLKFELLNKADNPDKIKSGEKIAGFLQSNKTFNKIIIGSLKELNNPHALAGTTKDESNEW